MMAASSSAAGSPVRAAKAGSKTPKGRSPKAAKGEPKESPPKGPQPPQPLQLGAVVLRTAVDEDIVKGVPAAPPVARSWRRESLQSCASTLDTDGDTAGSLATADGGSVAASDALVVDCWAQCGTCGPTVATDGGKPYMSKESVHNRDCLYFCAPCLRVVRALRRSVAGDSAAQRLLRSCKKNNTERYKQIIRSARISDNPNEPGLLGLGDAARRERSQVYKHSVCTSRGTEQHFKTVLMNRRQFCCYKQNKEAYSPEEAEALWQQSLAAVPEALREKEDGEWLVPVKKPKQIVATRSTRCSAEVIGQTELLNDEEARAALCLAGVSGSSSLTEGALAATGHAALHDQEMKGSFAPTKAPTDLWENVVLPAVQVEQAVPTLERNTAALLQAGDDCGSPGSSKRRREAASAPPSPKRRTLVHPSAVEQQAEEERIRMMRVILANRGRWSAAGGFPKAVKKHMAAVAALVARSSASEADDINNRYLSGLAPNLANVYEDRVRDLHQFCDTAATWTASNMRANCVKAR